MSQETKTAAETFAYDKDNLHGQPIELYTDKYKNSDAKEISERLGLPYDEEKKEFTLKFLGETYQIAHPEFDVKPVDPKEGAYYALVSDDSAKILVLRYLLQSHVIPFNGKFLSFREYPSAELYAKPFQGRCIIRFNFKYGKKLDVFEKIMQTLPAEKVKYADVCYDVELFDGLMVRFILWEGDEEFAASSQILFSESFTAAFEAYDLAEIGGICLNTFGAIEKTLN